MTENIEKSVEQQILQTVEQVLAAVKQKTTAYASHIWVPSLKKEVRFNELNTAQQKKLIKSIIDSPVLNTEFIYTLRDIIKENCVDSDINIDQFTILDKLVVALGIRINSIGSDLPIEIETKKGEKVSITLDLKKVYELAKDSIQTVQPQVFTDDIYYVECSTPTMETELRIEEGLKESLGDAGTGSNEQLRAILGDAFVGEIAKFVNTVSLKGESGEVPVAWESFSIKDRTKIIESFSTKLLKQIINYINQVRSEIDKVEVINFEFSGESFTRRLSIDGSFFMIS